MIMSAEQIKQYLVQRQQNIKTNITISQEQNNKERECWYTAQYQEVSDILKAIRWRREWAEYSAYFLVYRIVKLSENLLCGRIIRKLIY